MGLWQIVRKCAHDQRWRLLLISGVLFVLPRIQLSGQSVTENENISRVETATDSASVSSKHALSLEKTVSGTATQGNASYFCTPAPFRNQQAESEIGKKMAAEIELQGTIIHDPDISAYLNRLEQNIARNSDLQGCFNVQLIEDVEANAYSLPGGFLYLTSALILVSRSEGELTAALAHETAHVTAHHFARIEHERHLWGGLALAGGPAGYILRRLIGPLLTRKLIRNSEFEADRLSLKYQTAAGYDPSELSQLLRDMYEDDSDSTSFVQRLFDSHPLVTTRIKRLDMSVASLPPATTAHVVDSSDFHAVKEQLSHLLNFIVTPTATSKAH